MNDGKVCISVSAETIRDLVARIESTIGNGDLIEVRFDCLAAEELTADNVSTLKKALETIFDALDGKPCITTFRPREFGGCRELSPLERSNFWNMERESQVIDIEEDLIDSPSRWLWKERICSFHDFDGVPGNIDSIAERLLATGVEIV